MDTQDDGSIPVILCIDYPQNAPALEIRRQVLEAVGYRVLTTTCISDAREIIFGNNIDLVLTEQVDAASLAAMKRLKPRVPIAIYSADCRESQQAMRFAAVFITKLAPVDELLDTIADLLEKPTLIGTGVDWYLKAEIEIEQARILLDKSRSLIQASGKLASRAHSRLSQSLRAPQAQGSKRALRNRAETAAPHRVAA